MQADPARVKELFLAALDFPDTDARTAYLDGACRDETELRARVEALLLAHQQPDSLLDEPIVLPPVGAPAALAPSDTPTISSEAAAASEAGIASAATAYIEDFAFELGEEIGRGGMAVVYRAIQRGLNRPVAVKMLRPGDRADSMQLIRFLAESEAVAAVRHPHVIQVYEYGEREGHPYLAMELCEGGTLAERLADGPLASPKAAELLRKVASGVAAAHDLGIVHRDVKPGNILFDAGGEPKVSDFGLARRGLGTNLTATQATMGTPAYMSPEQAGGKAKFVGPQTDVWALGVVFYECLTGGRPFDGTDTDEVFARIRAANPLPPRRRLASIPRDLELICLKCLEKEPQERYPTARELAEDLERFLEGKLIGIRPAGLLERGYKWVRRNKVVSAAIAAVVLALIAGSVVSIAFSLEARKQAKQARESAERESKERVRANEKATEAATHAARAENEKAGAVKDRDEVQVAMAY